MAEVRRPCPVCGQEASLVTGRAIYPHRPDLYGKKFWACLKHDAYVGCHPGSERRMGRLATAATRRLKSAAHAAFDPLWKSGRMKRTDAYAWLRGRTGLSERDCHIGWMSDADLRRVIEICNAEQQEANPMTDITLEQRARELLAAEWEADGQVMLSGMIRLGHPAAINNEHTQRTLRAIEAALRLAVPDGWVLVPREPTDQMLAELLRPYESLGANFMREKYAAMLAAAPTVSAEGEG